MHPDDDPRFRHSAAAAAHLINVVLPPVEYPGGNARLYSAILYTILACVRAACDEREAGRLEPSEN